MTNTNPETGTPYGYISANALDPEVVQQLLYGSQARNLTDEHLLAEVEQEVEIEAAELGYVCGSRDWEDFVEQEVVQRLDDINNSGCYDDEPAITGTYKGVSYATSWLGGALNFWVFESPCTTDKARRASPCVPGAAILDTLDGDMFGYDVPADWRRK